MSGSKCRLTRCNPLLAIHAEFKKVSGIDNAKRVLVTLLKSVAGICGLAPFRKFVGFPEIIEHPLPPRILAEFTFCDVGIGIPFYLTRLNII